MRYIQENNIAKGTFWRIGRVYRRDQPSAGRFREFYQADWDLIGGEATPTADATVLRLIIDVLDRADVPRTSYSILYNSTANLKRLLLEQVGIAESSFKKICSTIDKLDKCSFDELVPEFTEKGLSVEQITQLRNGLENDIKDEGVGNQMVNIMSYWNGSDSVLKYTPSLARGLDYYNGLIFEVKLKEGGASIISGGRYDGLIGGRTGVGVSFGVSRMLSLMPTLLRKNIELNETWCKITTLGTVCEKEKQEVIEKIRGRTTTTLTFLRVVLCETNTLKGAIKDCLETGYGTLIIIAENEWNASKEIIVKNLVKRTQAKYVLC